MYILCLLLSISNQEYMCLDRDIFFLLVDCRYPSYLVSQFDSRAKGSSDHSDFMSPLGVSHSTQIHQHNPSVEPRWTVEWNLVLRSPIVKETWSHSCHRHIGKDLELIPELSETTEENDVRVQINHRLII